MQIKGEKRSPLNELNHTVDIAIDIELARLAVGDMTLARALDGGVVYTGRMTFMGAPGARVDLIVRDGAAYLRTCPLMGRSQVDEWAYRQVQQPMLTVIAA